MKQRSAGEFERYRFLLYIKTNEGIRAEPWATRFQNIKEHPYIWHAVD